SKSRTYLLGLSLVLAAEPLAWTQTPPAEPIPEAPLPEEPPASAEPPPSPAADELIPVVVVNVGARTPRTSVETTVPVAVVTASDTAHGGKRETGRTLPTLAPSFISTPQTISDGTDHVDPASLRGLGPDQVLVLVNGKRRHKSALVNVNGTFGR